MNHYIIKKVLNNNVLIALQDEDEVVLIGKGIGFGKKADQQITDDTVEKVYVLSSYHEQERFKTLMSMTDDNVIKATIEVVDIIKDQLSVAIDDKILLTLTDHFIFALKRMTDGIYVGNPFLTETEVLYPNEFHIASMVVDLLNQRLNVNFPRGEIGFVALHIHAATSNQSIKEMNLMTEIVSKAVHIIEHDLKVTIDKESLSYARFVRHISFAVQRVMADDRPKSQQNLESLLKIQYPLCYNIAVKIIKMMQRQLNQPVYESELVYLTMHIAQFNTEV